MPLKLYLFVAQKQSIEILPPDIAHFSAQYDDPFATAFMERSCVLE